MSLIGYTIVLGPAAVVAAVIAIGLNLISPFVGFAAAFKNGTSIVPAVFSVIKFFSDLTRARPGGVGVGIPTQNRRLHAQISRLTSRPNNFKFLNAAEISRLDEIPEAKQALNKYTQALEKINEDAGCKISLLGVEEMKACLTVEFNEGERRFYRSYETENFLNFIQAQQGRYVYIADNRIGINGLGQRVAGDQEPDPRYTNPKHYEFKLTKRSKTENYLSNKNGFKIYRGFHPELAKRLRNELGPQLEILRGLLLKPPAPAAKIESTLAAAPAEVRVIVAAPVQAEAKITGPLRGNQIPRNFARFTLHPAPRPGEAPRRGSTSSQNATASPALPRLSASSNSR